MGKTPSNLCGICRKKVHANKRYLRDMDSGKIFHIGCFRDKHPDVPIEGVNPGPHKKRGKKLEDQTMSEIRRVYRKKFGKGAPVDTTKGEIIEAIKSGKSIEKVREKRVGFESLEREIQLLPQVVTLKRGFFQCKAKEPKIISTRFGNLNDKNIGDVMIFNDQVMRWTGEEWLPEIQFLRVYPESKRCPIRTDVEVDMMTAPFIFQKNPSSNDDRRTGFSDASAATDWAHENGFLVDDVWWDIPTNTFGVKYRQGPSMAPKKRVQMNPLPSIPRGFLLARDQPYTGGLTLCGECQFYQGIGESAGNCSIDRQTDDLSMKVGDHLPCGFGVAR